MAPRKRKLQQRIKAVGEQIEASIREDAELQKLEFVASDELFQIDTAGGKLTKKQKLHQKDPVVKSNKFIAVKANKFETELVKKLAQREQPKRAAKSSKAVAGGPLWGSDGAVAVDKKIKELDPYVAPAVVKKVAAPSRVASTRHRIKKVAVPAPGQSYHPDFASHQDVLAEALAHELEKQALHEEQSKPVSGGLSEETLQFIRENSDDDDESDDEEGGSHMVRNRAQVRTNGWVVDDFMMMTASPRETHDPAAKQARPPSTNGDATQGQANGEVALEADQHVRAGGVECGVSLWPWRLMTFS
jgi:hypothetical protein